MAQSSSPIHRWFAALTLAISGWAFSIGLLHTGIAIELWSRLAFVSSAFIPSCFLGFTTVFPTMSPWPSKILLRTLVAIAAVFALLASATPFLISNAVFTLTGFARESGPLYPLFALYFLAVWLLGVYVFLTKFSGARGQARVQLQYLAIGLAISFLGGIATNLLAPFLFGRTGFTWLGPYFTVPLVASIGHTVSRHRLLDLRLIAHRTIGFAISLLTIAGGIVLLARFVADFRLTQTAPIPIAPLIFVLVALLLLSAPMSPYLVAVIDRYFLRGRVDHDRILIDATRRLQRLVEKNALVAELGTLLSDSLAPDRIVILFAANNRRGWGRVLDNTALALAETDNTAFDAAWRLDAELPGVLLLETLTGDPARDRQRQAQVLRTAGFELWLGLGRSHEKHAVILLGPRRSGEAYFANHFDFLDALAEIATIATEIIDLHRRQLSLERARQRDAHLARMAKLYAGLAHEIRTPLTTLSNLISMLPDRLDDSDYRQLLVTLVPGEVARISALAEKFRAMAPGTSPRGAVDLGHLLHNIVTLQSSRLSGRSLELSLSVASDLPAISGDHDRLVQLFTNLIQNAIDASPPGGHIAVRVQASDSNVIAEVVDEGTGLSSEIEDRLFEPFLTTKPAGMGLGLSICREIAESHNARLILENREGHVGARAEVVFLLNSSAAVSAAS